MPRALWPSKQSIRRGSWFNQTVLGQDDDAVTSVGMGPVTFLYIAGGTALIVVGFFALGWLQALLFEGFARSGAGGLIMYLSVAMILVFIPSEVGPALTSLLRLLPLAFLSQFILLRASRRTGMRDGTWRSPRFARECAVKRIGMLP